MNSPDDLHGLPGGRSEVWWVSVTDLQTPLWWYEPQKDHSLACSREPLAVEGYTTSLWSPIVTFT